MDTARARAEAALRRDATLEAVAFAAQRFLEEPDWRRSIHAVLRRLGQASGVSRVYLYENVEREGELRTVLRAQWVADRAFDRVAEGTELAFSGLERWVATLGRGDVLHGPLSELPASEQPTIRDHGIASLLLTPLSVGGSWWGYMGFDDCVEERVWTQIEIDALRAAASTLAAAINRQRSEDRLRETEARFRQLVEQVPAATYVDEPDPVTGVWRSTYVSPQVEQLLGVPPDEALVDTATWAARVHPEDVDAALAATERHYRTGEPLYAEYRMFHRDGHEVWIRDQAALYVDADGRRYSQGVYIDVTESKRAEAALREAEARYRTIVETTPAITYQEHLTKGYDVEGSVVYVSPQVERILGYSAKSWAEVPGFWLQILHPDDRDAVIAESERTTLTGEPYRQEYRMIAADGRVVWFRDESIQIVDPHGTPQVWQGVMIDITEIKEAEERLREAQERFRVLVEHLPAVTYREAEDANPEDFYISPQVERVFGYTVDEWTWTPRFWSDRLHPDDRERVLALDRETNRTHEAYASEYRLRKKDGSWVWIHDEATFVEGVGGPGFWQGFLLDITERKQAEAALAEAEARYRAIVEQAPVAIYTQEVRPDGSTDTVFISRQHDAMFGWTVEEVQASPGLWREILHPDDRDRVLAADAETNRSGERWVQEYRMRHKDGHWVWVRDEAAMIRGAEGAPRLWQGYLMDITERKRAEERLEEALAVEREAAQRLRALDEMKNTFLQAVSHDLRTPLAAILGLAVTLERADIELGSEDTRDLAARIAANARKLDRMVADLLDLDRLARGIVEPRLYPTDVGALVTRVVGDSDLAASRRVLVETEEVVVNVDAAKVERIVENLLANTARHTPDDTRVWIRVERAEGGALIVVEDDGPGIAAAHREAVFEPFRQGPDAPEHSPGVGVGLTLVARFAELMGGRAWVQERQGGGASFRVYLADGPSTVTAAGSAG
jgi:PAS domain S-box-containing protein